MTTTAYVWLTLLLVAGSATAVVMLHKADGDFRDDPTARRVLIGGAAFWAILAAAAGVVMLLPLVQC